MPLGFLLKAVRGCDYDSDELYKSPEHAAFIKNMCLDLTVNRSTSEGADGREGDNKGTFTPPESTGEMCPIPLSDGDNYCIGYYEAKETNEGYVFVFNSQGNHVIYVLDGATGYCNLVMRDPCLRFRLHPEYFINSTRCVLQVVSVFNKSTGLLEKKKFLVFTDNGADVHSICVGDAIATGGFTHPFFKNCHCETINLAVPTPSSCIKITAVNRAAGDNRENLMQGKAWQFRIKTVDVWNRASEHGIISDLYYIGGASCLTESGLPRCVDLTFDTGCPTVNKIQIEYRIWSGNDPDLSVPTDWYLHDTLDKYDQVNTALRFWERSINVVDFIHDPAANTFTYRFCADKGTTALPVEETNRNENPVPQTAAAVFSANQSIGLANNKHKFPPLSPSVLQKIDFSVERPDPSKSCFPKTRTITIYAHIINTLDVNQVELRKDGDNVIYGKASNPICYEFKQYLPPGQEGFIGYFAGTNEYAISEQCRFNKQTKELVVVGTDYTQGVTEQAQLQNMTAYYIPVQRWTFKNVTPGKKIFRVANQLATVNSDYQKTSFATSGISNFPNIFTYFTGGQDLHEMIIDQCEGVVDLQDRTFILNDLTKTGSPLPNAIVGYLYEDEVSKLPIEKALISVPSHAKHPKYTDHNGFYWATSEKRNWHVDLYGTRKCAKGALLIATSPEVLDAPNSRFRDQKFYVYNGTVEYPRTDRLYIKGKVILCNQPTVGVGGVLVMLTGGATAITDELGNYTIIAHDQGDTQARQDRLMYAQAGVCAIGRCDNECSTCFDDTLITAPVCDGVQDRLITATPLQVSLRRQLARGPQNGGRYELGIVLHDWAGRQTFVQRLPQHVVDTPTIGENSAYDFSRIRYSIAAGTQFPATFKYLTFVISKNLNYDDFLMWVAEKVEYVDNTGNVNTVNPTQVKLYYTGLGEYNSENGLATNTVWQFLQANSNSPTVGDRLEFVANGDGTIFNKRISTLVKFDQKGKYVLVNYTEDLRGLKDGLQLKLIRPRSNRNSQLYYEQCTVIRLDNGKVVAGQSSGYLNYFDAYMLNRSIPIPYYKTDGTQDKSKSILKNFTFPFEHHSPSDFWGDHAANRGRVFAVNPYENQVARSTQIMLSAALAGEGLINGLSYFSDNDAVEYDQQEWGSITAVVAGVGMLNVICEQDNFEVGLDDTTVRVGEDGTLNANPLSRRLGRPQRRRGKSYGCVMADINTIQEYSGAIVFLDRTRAALVFLQGDAKDASVNGYKGHLKAKIKHLQQVNAPGQEESVWKYFHAVIDPRRKEYLLTMFTVPVTGIGALPISDYVNQLRQKSVTANETLAIDLGTGALRTQYSYTPEYFGTLYGHKDDLQLISFKNGRAYQHHTKAPATAKSYLEFYGVLCEPVYDVVLAYDPDGEKTFLWTEVLCREQQFFCDRIVTDSGQESRLLLAAWEKRDNFWTAPFYGNMLTQDDKNIPSLNTSKLLEGDLLTGRWVRARYVARTKTSQKYFELDGVHIFIYEKKKSGNRER